jgi:hypothetical protein
MNPQHSKSIWRTILGDNPGLAWLFFALIGFFVAGPLLSESRAGTLLLDLLLFGVLIFSAYAVSNNRKVLIVAILLALPTTTFWLGARTINSTPLALIGLVFSAVFFLYIVGVLLRGVLKSEQVDADTLYGAVTAYLLIGVTWSFFYAMVHIIVPDAFTFGPLATFVKADPMFGDLRFFIYYSLVTLSTLGYGDITPLAPMARTLASLEAVLGQLYIAVAVAALVGTHIAQKQRS